MKPHLHRYKLDCEMSNLHDHRVWGYTERMVGFNAFHFHYFSGVSSYRNHTHYYAGITGLPIRTENGHIHRIDGILEFNAVHEHKFSSYTNEDIEYILKKPGKVSYI